MTWISLVGITLAVFALIATLAVRAGFLAEFVDTILGANAHVTVYSAGHPTADGRMKPDLVAPGENILSARHQWPKQGDNARDYYVEMSGTSMATPHVAGVAALWAQQLAAKNALNVFNLIGRLAGTATAICLGWGRCRLSI